MSDAERIVADAVFPDLAVGGEYGRERAARMSYEAVRALAENPTPAMIEAGARAWGAARATTPDEEIVAVIFAAMLSAETREEPGYELTTDDGRVVRVRAETRDEQP